MVTWQAVKELCRPVAALWPALVCLVALVIIGNYGPPIWRH